MITGLPKEDLETVIDRLHEFVKINKRISLSSAAGALGLPLAQAERLALLLEESGLIMVQYSLGKTELLAKEDPNALVATPIGEGKSLREIAKTLEHEVMESESVMEFMQRDLRRRIKLAEDSITSMEHTGAFSTEDVAFLKKELGILDAQLQHFRYEVAELSGIEKEFEGKVKQFRDRISALEGTPVSQETKPTSPSPLYFAIKPLADLLSGLKNFLFILLGRTPKQPRLDAPKAVARIGTAMPPAGVKLDEATPKEAKPVEATLSKAAPAEETPKKGVMEAPRAGQPSMAAAAVRNVEKTTVRRTQKKARAALAGAGKKKSAKKTKRRKG